MIRIHRRRALIGATLVTLAVGALAGTAAASTTSNTQAPGAPDASIPFANRGGILDWQADKDQGVWVQDIHRHWYYAKLMGPCIGLNFANSIGFDTRPLGNFDRFSAIVVPGTGRCTVRSFTVSEGPRVEKNRKE